jgi:DNA-binding PadR family transcriptional regulator
MFNREGRHFAFQFHGGDYAWEAQALPQQHRWHGFGPYFFSMRRRGFFGPKGPFGPEGPFGPDNSGRFFGRGDVKFALLELLQERPMHGYEMMKALEERSGGFYAPSAGSIYPTLQMLEDRELVTVQEIDGKKIYKITDAGRVLLTERQKDTEFTDTPWKRGFGPGSRWNEPELQALRGESTEVARLFVIAGRSSFRDPQKLNKLRTIIERTRKELSELIYGDNPPQDQDTTK